MSVLSNFEESIRSLFGANRKGGYNFGNQVINGSTQFNRYSQDKEKLSAALSNPALLKVLSIQCDLFSIAKFKVKDRQGNDIENDPFLKWIDSPNPLQTGQQFLWDFMFWEMLGNAYIYTNSRLIESPLNICYLLEPRKIDFPISLEREKDKLIFSESKLKSIMSTELTYRYEDGTYFKFPLEKLIVSNDLTNGVGNWYKGPSKIDALYKIISNSEFTLDSKNINLRLSQKFMVGSNRTIDGMGLTQPEKDDLKYKILDDGNQIYPTSSMAQIQRFVEDFQKLRLSENYLDEYFLIGNMYNIPRDVLEAYQSSTFENQEKARGSHVSYTLEPKGEEFCNHFEKHFRYKDDEKQIQMSWNHLPFMQVFEKDFAEKDNIKAETMKILVENGIPLKEARDIVKL